MIDSNIWEDILSRVQAKVNRHSFYTWFKPTAFVADDGQTVTVRVPNALFKDWITKHYSGVISEALGEVERSESLVSFVASGTRRSPIAEAAAAATDAPLRSTEAGARDEDGETGLANTTHRRSANVFGGLESALHVRHVHRRVVQSVRARGVPRRCRSALSFLQPAVHLRWCGTRQDALDARHRPLRAAPQSQPRAHLHFVRALHERDDQCRPLRSSHRLSRAVSQRRRAPGRRCAVSRRERGYAERVFPHVQRAVRFPEADCPEQRLPAA